MEHVSKYRAIYPTMDEIPSVDHISISNFIAWIEFKEKETGLEFVGAMPAEGLNGNLIGGLFK